MIGSLDDLLIPFPILVRHVFSLRFEKINCLYIIINYAFSDCILNCLCVEL